MLKKYLSKVIAVVVVISSLVSGWGVARADQAVSVFVNRNEVISDQPAFNEDGSNITYVPLRAVAQALNGKVSWDENTQQITIERNGRVVVLKVGSSQVMVDGKEVVLPGPVKVMPDTYRSVVPVRFFADALSLQVKISASAGVGILDENNMEPKN